jgi:hypothetical protein
MQSTGKWVCWERQLCGGAHGYLTAAIGATRRRFYGITNTARQCIDDQGDSTAWEVPLVKPLRECLGMMNYRLPTYSCGA